MENKKVDTIKIQQVSRRETITLGGSEVIREFIIEPYYAHAEFIYKLLGGVRGEERIIPDIDTYYGNYFCYQCDVKSLDDTGFTSSPGFSTFTLDKWKNLDFKMLTNILKTEYPAGGAIVTAKYRPIALSTTSSQTKQNKVKISRMFDYVDFKLEPFTTFVKIPKEALYDIPQIAGLGKAVDDLVLTKAESHAKISFKRINIPGNIVQSKLLNVIAKLTNKVNEDDYQFPDFQTFTFPKETLRFDGAVITPKNNLTFNQITDVDGTKLNNINIDINLNSSSMFQSYDITYNFTIRWVYDEMLVTDDPTNFFFKFGQGFVGWNRVFAYPGFVKVANIAQSKWYNPAYYPVGWRKNLIAGTDLVKQYTSAESAVPAKDGVGAGFDALLEYVDIYGAAF